MDIKFSKKDPNSFPFNSVMVSGIIERTNEAGEVEILLQRRINPNDLVYRGTWEIPAGHPNKFENVYTALRREIKEEAGLEVYEFLDSKQTEEYGGQDDDGAFAFEPFICKQYLRGRGWGWIGFVFRCSVKSSQTAETEEAKDFKWVTAKTLQEMLKTPHDFFTLHLPVLEYYVKWREEKGG